MIYGWNFTGESIPPHVKLRFAERKRFKTEAVTDGLQRKEVPIRQGDEVFARLQGACNTEGELTAMVIQADNGHRRISYVGPRKIAGELWYGVYCG